MAIKQADQPALPVAEPVAKPEDDMVEAQVAPGRSVFDEVRSYTSFNKDRNADEQINKPHNPKVGIRGQALPIVKLPRDEAQRLMALGFLVDPGAQGPDFIDDGATVTAAQASGVKAA